jgi:penicillin amidase
MARLILSPKLGPTQQADGVQQEPTSDLTSRLMGKGPVPVLADVSLHAELWLPWLSNLLTQPDSHWFDLGNGEKRDDVMRKALRDTLDELCDIFGPRISDWTWGKIHQLKFSHPLGSIKSLKRFFNRGPYPLGGDQTTIWASGASYYDLNSERVIGPPFRMIVDLSDLTNSLALLNPGQSGNPISPHYDDQIDAWFRKEYHPMLFNRQDIEHASSQILHLIPRSPSKPKNRASS